MSNEHTQIAALLRSVGSAQLAVILGQYAVECAETAEAAGKNRRAQAFGHAAEALSAAAEGLKLAEEPNSAGAVFCTLADAADEYAQQAR